MSLNSLIFVPILQMCTFSNVSKLISFDHVCPLEQYSILHSVCTYGSISVCNAQNLYTLMYLIETHKNHKPLEQFDPMLDLLPSIVGWSYVDVH